MSAFLPVAFNLYLNAISSFVWALGLTLLLLRVLRAGPGRSRLLLLLLPFVKVLWDLAHGIPGDSFVWAGLRGAQPGLGAFQVGVGVGRPLIVIVRLVLGVYSNGVNYSQSAADALYRLLVRQWTWAIPAALLGALFAVAALRLFVRARAHLAFRREIARMIARASRVTSVRVGRRCVRVYDCDAYEGVPFVFGVVSPSVIVPAASFAALGARARHAALEHELAHVAHHDAPLLLALSLFSDLFWFLPGGALLERRVRAELELTADARAVRRGVHPDALAEALVSFGERLQATPHAALGLQRKGLLRERVERLLGERPDRARSLYRWSLGKMLVFALFVPFLMTTVFWGNSWR